MDSTVTPEATEASSAELKPRAKILLVAGMHRSGTSALTRVLNLLGAEIPGPLVPGFHGNDLGHWEPEAIVQVHEEMLRSAKVNVNSVFGVPDAWFVSADADAFVERLSDILAPYMAQGGLKVVKDPRMALFLPIWLRALSKMAVQPVVVLPFRDPLEVAASLQMRQMQVFPDAVWPLGRGVLLWLRYVLTAEKASRGLSRSFVSYDALLNDWRQQISRVATQLDVAWPHAQDEARIAQFLQRNHKHAQRLDFAGEEFGLADTVFGLLGAATQAPDGDAEGFDAAGHAFDRSCMLFNDYVEQLELRLGETLSLRTEYVDFLRKAHPAPIVGVTKGVAAMDAALNEPDEERRRSLLTSARIEHAGLAALASETTALNLALLAAARRLEQAHACELGAAEQSVHEALKAREEAQTTVEAHIRASEALRDAARAGVDIADAKREQAQAAAAHAETERARAVAERDDAVGARESLEAALGAAEARHARSEAELALARTERERVDARIEAEAEHLADERTRTLELLQQLREEKEARDGALEQLERSRRVEADLRGSTSWRVTAPLRAAATRLLRR